MRPLIRLLALGIIGLWKFNPLSTKLAGANGITRGLYVNPTLTAAADFRAIETTVGNVIFNNGNVGIGTTSPWAEVSVAGSGVADTAPAFAISDLASTTRMVVLDNGNVGIGTTSPSQLLTVGNNNQFTVSSTGAVTAIGVNSGSGQIQGTGGLNLSDVGAFNSSLTVSDLRTNQIRGGTGASAYIYPYGLCLYCIWRWIFDFNICWWKYCWKYIGQISLE